MRTLRLWLAATASLALLGATSIAVVAQADETGEEPVSSPVVVTGTMECLSSEPSGEGDEGPIGQSVVTVHTWQATDPRLTGEVSYSGRWQLYEPPSEDVGVGDADRGAAIYEIVNDGGGWLCEAARGAEPRIGDTDHTLVFSGTDEYEGLTAYLNVDFTATPYTFTGLILPGEAPPYAPPAE